MPGNDRFDTLAVWDSGALRQLVGDRIALQRSLLTNYLGHADTLLPQLAQALRQGDGAQASAIAHRLKSASRSVGAMRLGALCEAAELAGQSGLAAGDAALALELESNLAQARAAITASAVMAAPDAG